MLAALMEPEAVTQSAEHHGWFWLCRIVGNRETVTPLEPLEPKVYGVNGALTNGSGRITYVARRCRAWVVTNPYLTYVAIDTTAAKALKAARCIRAQHCAKVTHD